jgi:hypothetical protein
LRPVQLAGSGRETACIGDRYQHLQLIERWVGLHVSSNLQMETIENIPVFPMD